MCLKYLSISTEISKSSAWNISNTFTTSLNDFDTNFSLKAKTLPPCVVFLMKSLTCLFLGVYKILLSSFKTLPKQDQPTAASVKLFLYETSVIF